jgi:uncharacterized membrane protein YphA (DoxX/SURF4 family)
MSLRELSRWSLASPQAEPCLAPHQSRMVPRTLLVLPRLYLGVVFAVAVYAKLTAPGGFPKTLAGFLGGFAMQSGFAWYKTFLSAVVLPHIDVFAYLVIAGELTVAVCMLLGIATRAAALVAILLLANYLSTKGFPLWAPASNDTADIVLAVTVFFGAAGRTLGFDRVLHERFPNFFAW